MHIYIPRHILRIIAVVVLCGLFSGYSFIKAAWNEPIAAPPGSNVDAPLNVGTAPQVKSGGLGVDTLAVYGLAGLDSLTVSSTATMNQLVINDTTVNGTSSLNKVYASDVVSTGTAIINKLRVSQYCGVNGGNCVSGDMLIKVAEKISTVLSQASRSGAINEWNKMVTDANANKTALTGGGFASSIITSCTWDSATESAPTASDADVQEALDDCMGQFCSWHPSLNINTKSGGVGNLVVNDGFACGWPSGAPPNSGPCTVGYYKIDCLYY
jgi:hypothetical protein